MLPSANLIIRGALTRLPAELLADVTLARGTGTTGEKWASVEANTGQKEGSWGS